MSSTNARVHPGGHEPPSPHPAAPSAWLEELGPPLLQLLAEHGVSIDSAAPRALCFHAVPVAEPFSKPRTNLLLQRLAPGGGCTVYVDSDLAYTGDEQALLEILAGPTRRHWRRLCLPPVPGTLPEALLTVLELLGSPITGEVRRAVALADDAAPPTGQRRLGRMLAAVGEVLKPAALAETLATCTRQDLATRVAVIPTRPVPPRCAVLWGEPGCGRTHLMLAAARALAEAGWVSEVVHVTAGKVAAGCIFPAELDSALMRLLGEALALDDAVLLVEDLEVCVSGSPASYSLLCDAIDRGLRFLATAHSQAHLKRLQNDAALARRIVAVHVEPPTREEVAEMAARLAEDHGVALEPAALQAALNLARKTGGGQPAGSLGLLGAAIAEVLWRGDDTVHPDDILTLEDQWPEDQGKE